MLLEFRVENFRSLRDEQALTFEASAKDTDSRLRRVDGSTRPLLPVVALYGANASGKSNLLLALKFMAGAVRRSFGWPPHDGVPGHAPFAAEGTSTRPSLFEAVFLVGGVRYRYGFVVNADRVLEEWLHAWPFGRKQVWFERDDLEFRFGAKLRGPKQQVAEGTRSNALFLSTAAQHNHKQLAAIYTWFVGVQFHAPRDLDAPGESIWPAVLRRMILSKEPIRGVDAPAREALLKMARSADLGIVDVREDTDLSEQLGWAVAHQMADGVAWLPLEVESRGTQVFLFRLGPLVLWTLHHGGLLVVDELESSLHPLLAAEIVRLFGAPETNPRDAQLLFTTHNTELLGNQLGETPLRRDQIWITEKDPHGATALFPLTDFHARKHENLERGYLQGRYGGVPMLGDLVHAPTRP